MQQVILQDSLRVEHVTERTEENKRYWYNKMQKDVIRQLDDNMIEVSFDEIKGIFTALTYLISLIDSSAPNMAS